MNATIIAGELAPTISLSKAPAPDDTPDDKLADDDVTITSYDGIKWDRLPNLTKPYRGLTRKVSWIYKYGYRC